MDPENRKRREMPVVSTLGCDVGRTEERSGRVNQHRCDENLVHVVESHLVGSVQNERTSV